MKTKKIFILLVVIGFVIGLAVGFWFCHKGPTVYRVYEFSLDKKD